MRSASKQGLATVVFAAVVLVAGGASAANNALKDVMKSMGVTATGDDAKLLVPLFDKTIASKPNDPDFAAWTAIAERGKAAAEKGDLAGAKATCKDCHTQLRDKFKTKYSSKAP